MLQKNNKIRTKNWQKLVLIVSGILAALILAELTLRFTGFALYSVQLSESKVKPTNSTYVILALGESTTADVFNDQGSWPSELEKILNEKSKTVKFIVINAGIPGGTTGDIVSRLSYNLDKYNPQMVVTMMGINDEEPYKEATISSTILKELRLYKLAKWSLQNKDNTILKQNKSEPGKNSSEEISINVQKTDRNVELGQKYLESGDFKSSEASFRTALENGPNDAAYIGLAKLYQDKNMSASAEEMFKLAIKTNPKNYMNYDAAGWFYYFEYRPNDSESMFKKALALNHELGASQIGLGYTYTSMGKYDQAENVLQEALEKNPNDFKILLALRNLKNQYVETNYTEKKILEEIKDNPKNPNLLLELAWLYYNQGRYDDAANLFKDLIETTQDSPYPFSGLGYVYQKQGKIIEAQKMFQKAEALATTHINNFTKWNYNRLYKIVHERGIKLVCMQYPTKPLSEIKTYFSGNENIIFVGNEDNFRQTLRNGKYNDYFVDNFAVQFGHCTRKGNQMIAENLANVILRELNLNPTGRF